VIELLTAATGVAFDVDSTVGRCRLKPAETRVESALVL
jgi:hypothetical protein